MLRNNNNLGINDRFLDLTNYRHHGMREKWGQKQQFEKTFKHTNFLSNAFEFLS